MGCRAIGKWPSGVASETTVFQFVESLLPFHPTRHGIQNFDDPNGLVEERIRRIPDYEELQETQAEVKRGPDNGLQQPPEEELQREAKVDTDAEADVKAGTEAKSDLKEGLRRLAGELLESAEEARRNGDEALARRRLSECKEVQGVLEELRAESSGSKAFCVDDLYPGW